MHILPCSVSWQHPNNNEYTECQILVTNAIPQKKEPEVLEKMAGLNTRAGTVQNEPEASCSA